MLRRGEPGGDDGGSGDGPNRARRGEAPPSVAVAESSDVRALSFTRSVSLAYEALAATTDTGGGLCFSLPFSLALCVSIPRRPPRVTSNRLGLRDNLAYRQPGQGRILELA